MNMYSKGVHVGVFPNTFHDNTNSKGRSRQCFFSVCFLGSRRHQTDRIAKKQFEHKINVLDYAGFKLLLFFHLLKNTSTKIDSTFTNKRKKKTSAKSAYSVWPL